MKIQFNPLLIIRIELQSRFLDFDDWSKEYVELIQSGVDSGNVDGDQFFVALQRLVAFFV